MSIQELAAQLAVVLARLAEARRSLTTAAVSLGEAREMARTATRGTTQSGPKQAAAQLANARREVAEARDRCHQADVAIQAYMAEVGIPVPGAALFGVSSPQERPRASARPAGVANRHGDRYPEAALPYSDGLPPRVLRGTRNVPIVGHINLDGRDVGTIGAAFGDVWEKDSTSRMRALGLRRALGVAHHVEMKAVVMMIKTGARHARVIINHSPCGSQPGASLGCDTFLPDVVPQGSTVTVLGTDAHGEAFERTYHGRAVR